MSHKIIVSKKGYDALTESNPKNLIFDSDLNHLKTAVYGTLAISSVANGAESVGEIVHGLGIRPLVLAYWRDTANNNWFIPMSNPEPTTQRAAVAMNVEVYVDEDKVYFNAQNQSGSVKSFEIQYEIFYEGDS